MSTENAPLVDTPSLSRRWACMLYEALLLTGVVFATGFLFGVLTQTRNALDNRLGLQALLFIVLGVYFVWFWSKGGQTLAMKTWHLSLRDQNGALVSQGRACVRYLLAWVWVIPPVVAASSMKAAPAGTIAIVIVWIGIWSMLSFLRKDRQFLHDAWAHTKLVYTKPVRPQT